MQTNFEAENETIYFDSLVFVFLITIGYKKREIASPELIKYCFTCDTVPEGIIFCDDFESETLLKNRYFEYDDNGEDFARVIKVRAVWQQGKTSVGSLKKNLSEERQMNILAPCSVF